MAFGLGMTDPAQQAIAAFRTSHGRLTSLVAPLSPGGLTRPSFADGWSIADVLSHLGSQAELMHRYLDAALEGNGEPDRALFPEVWDRWNALSPVEQRAASADADEHHITALEEIARNCQTPLDITLFGGHVRTDLAGYVRIRLLEHAVHTWDVAVVLDPDATVAADAVSVLAREAPYVAERTSRPTDRRYRAHLVVTEPPAEWLLAVDETTSVGPWSDETVVATVRLSAEELLRLFYGRHGESDPIEIDGDLDVAELRAPFPGI